MQPKSSTSQGDPARAAGRLTVDAHKVKGETIPLRVRRESDRMRFVKESRIIAPPQRVFDFHESEGALQRLTPPWEKVEVESGGHSIRPGSRVVLKTKLGPIALRWVAEHVDYDPPHLFSDRQVSGPFARWFHRHHFLDDGQGGTILRDEVDYEPPMGWLGRVVAGRFVAEKLRKMFDYRHETTRRIVESGELPSDESASVIA